MTPAEQICEEAWAQWLDEFCDALRLIARKAKTSPLYWMGSKNEERCRRHAGRKGYADPGHGSDTQRYCQHPRCGRILQHEFTDAGVDEELMCSSDEELQGQPITPEEAFTLLRVIERGVRRTSESLYWLQPLTSGPTVIDLTRRTDLLRIAKRLEVKYEPGAH